MSDIIIYGSNYGSSEKYAMELSEKTSIKAVSYKELDNINNYSKIIYIGGLYAGGVVGLAKTFKKLKDLSSKKIIIVTVGLADSKDEKNILNIRKSLKEQINSEIFKKAQIFHLRGSIDYSKLSFTHKTMMKLMYMKLKNIPEDKQDAETKGIIETYNKKVDFIDFTSLNEIIAEIEK